MSHKSTGPLTPEQLKEFARGPFGAGLKAIREHDPFYGYREGEKFKWDVQVSCRAYGRAIVMAADEESAYEAATKLLADSDITYDDWSHHRVDLVKPARE